MVCHSDYEGAAYNAVSSATPELAWGLIIAAVRRLAQEDGRMRQGLWEGSAGVILAGRTLGLLGLGRIGKRMARYAQAFDMPVIAWSQNLTAEAAAADGVTRVDKDQLFARADILSIHLRLSARTRDLVAARELGLMMPQAYLINTSRDRRRGRAAAGPARPAHCRGGPGRVRRRAAAGRSSVARHGQRHPDPAPRLQHPRDHARLLWRHARGDRRLRQRASDPGVQSRSGAATTFGAQLSPPSAPDLGRPHDRVKTPHASDRNGRRTYLGDRNGGWASWV